MSSSFRQGPNQQWPRRCFGRQGAAQQAVVLAAWAGPDTPAANGRIGPVPSPARVRGTFRPPGIAGEQRDTTLPLRIQIVRQWGG